MAGLFLHDDLGVWPFLESVEVERRNKSSADNADA
jgi:hypothetical protein